MDQNYQYLNVIIDEITSYFKDFDDFDSDDEKDRPLTDDEINQFFQRNDVMTAISAVITEVKELERDNWEFDISEGVIPSQTFEEYTPSNEIFRDFIFDGVLMQLIKDYKNSCLNPS